MFQPMVFIGFFLFPKRYSMGTPKVDFVKGQGETFVKRTFFYYVNSGLPLMKVVLLNKIAIGF